MKQFIYLDTDIVTSIIAQEEKGLITQQTQEKDTSSDKTVEKEMDASASAKGGGKVLKFIQAEAELDLSGNLKHITSNASSTKDVAEKILHDAAFDIAYNYIIPTKVEYGNDMVGEEGEYLEIVRVYDYVDFTYLEKLFEKGGIIEFIKQNAADEIEKRAKQLVQNMSREQARRAETKLKNETKNQINNNSKQYDEVLRMIKAIKQLIPYDRMLISNDGFLMPLDDKYFRINPTNLGFKYGGEMTCVGMVTNIIGKDTDPCDDKNIFANIQYSVNEVLRSILPTKNDNICVIHPIAIYYGR